MWDSRSPPPLPSLRSDKFAQHNAIPFIRVSSFVNVSRFHWQNVLLLFWAEQKRERRPPYSLENPRMHIERTHAHSITHSYLHPCRHHRMPKTYMLNADACRTLPACYRICEMGGTALVIMCAFCCCVCALIAVHLEYKTYKHTHAHTCAETCFVHPFECDPVHL